MRRALSLPVVALLLLGTSHSSGAAAGPPAGPTPGIACAKGSLPEVMQGRAPAEDVAGRAAEGLHLQRGADRSRRA